MKAKRILLFGLMLVLTGIAHAEDILSAQNVKVAAGGSITLNVELSNTTTNLMGWQCDINLPEGLTLELKQNGKPKVTLGERFSTTEHDISSSCPANGYYRFIGTSLGGEAIPGTSGTLFSVTLKADASLTPGTVLTGNIKNIEFNTQDNHKLPFANSSFKITVEDAVLLGDVNNDNTVNIADAECIVNHITGKPNQTFNSAAADVNKDGVVDIADAVRIVNLIISKI